MKRTGCAAARDVGTVALAQHACPLIASSARVECWQPSPFSRLRFAIASPLLLPLSIFFSDACPRLTPCARAPSGDVRTSSPTAPVFSFSSHLVLKTGFSHCLGQVPRKRCGTEATLHTMTATGDAFRCHARVASRYSRRLLFSIPVLVSFQALFLPSPPPFPTTVFSSAHMGNAGEAPREARLP